MARKKEIKPIEPLGPDFVTTTPQDMQDDEAAWRREQITQERNLAVVDRSYGDNLPYDKTRLENEARFYMQESAMAMLEAGKRLVVLKEHEEHGRFAESLERIGISARAAQKMMQVAVKFSNAPALAHLGRTKMLELMAEDDEDLEALAEGGTVAGLKLDAIEKMTTRELKEALRKERESRKSDAEVAENLLAKKDEKINDLDKALYERTRRVKEWDGVITELTANIMTMSGGAIQNIRHLDAQIGETLQEAQARSLSDEEVSAIAEPLYDALITIQEHLTSLRARFDNELYGYLPVHDAPFTPLHQLGQVTE